MVRIRASAKAMVALLAIGGSLGGCAGAGERLPECRGTAVPINSGVASGLSGRAEVGGGRPDPGTVRAGADDEP